MPSRQLGHAFGQNMYIINWQSERRSGKIDVRITSALVTFEVVGSIPGQTHSSCDREGDSDCVGFLFGSGFLLHTLQIVHRANNILTLSSQFNRPKRAGDTGRRRGSKNYKASPRLTCLVISLKPNQKATVRALSKMMIPNRDD
jgi:carotenoid cleavage dioxygenase-like enzyme